MLSVLESQFEHWPLLDFTQEAKENGIRFEPAGKNQLVSHKSCLAEVVEMSTFFTSFSNSTDQRENERDEESGVEGTMQNNNADSINASLPSVEVQHSSCCRRPRMPKIGFDYEDPRAFYTSQWNIPPALFVCYRFLIAGYAVTILALSLTYFDRSRWDHTWPTYLTNWTYTLLTSHLIFAALVSMYETTHFDGFGFKSFSEVDMRRNQMLTYHKISWLLFATVSIGAFMVTIVYFSAIYPQFHQSSVSQEDIHLHIMNSMLVILDLLISAYPFRFSHLIYPLIYGFVYTSFSIVYWSFDHSRVIYPIVLDWNHPLSTCMYVALLSVIGIPVISLICFAFHQIRHGISSRYYNLSTPPGYQRISVVVPDNEC
ncbi:hypothetical protein CAPTEDRAFT_227205 [Capitella teleta]|uniref:Protein rolling stone n=1 Tax=Capitella teleta TaxID=283909 RepID=R7T9R3_CAPTE|nr:hypothetical protein CAPTEDRAFT_227205 [Capitella teleta]|eukprot:ELT87729.1 hypothetical protein CAPTEDRAFT_227205 [Capitella teleta]